MGVWMGHSLLQRLLRASLATTVLALIVANLTFSLFQYDRNRVTAIDEATAIADILTQNLAAAIVFENELAAEEVIQSLALKPSVWAAYIFRNDGTIFAIFGDPTYIDTFHGTETRSIETPVRFNQIHISREIKAAGEVVGRLGLIIRVECFASWFLHTIKFMLPILVVSILIATLISRRLMREIMRPFERLVEGLRTIGTSSDHVTLLADVDAGRELTPLYSRFNELVAEIDKQRRLLAESEARYRSIVETQSEAICRLDKNFRLQFANKAFQDIVGIRLGDLIGTRPTNLVPAEDCSIIETALSKLSPTSETQEINCRINGGKQELRWIQATIRAFFDNQGRPSEYMLVGRDISEKKIAEQIAIQTSKLATLGDISTSIAHELKQPLAVIDLAVQNTLSALEDSTLTEQEIRRYLSDKMNRLANNSERIRTIIDHLRVFGRKVDDQRFAFDPRESMKAALMLIQHRLEQAGITLQFSSGEAPPLVRGHPILFEQVLLNLLTNSIDAIESGKEAAGGSSDSYILVSLVRNDFGLCCILEDSGGGIPGPLMTRATERYFTTKPAGKGTGLGLAISSDIVKEMGGKMRLEQGKKGLKVTIELPLSYSDNHDNDYAVA
ncbi:ATP-binding protein [Limibacillus sp. MBR-115]|jgi:PAS domain S-box-containing protein|uniref:ATP-binding protein n=1 Tax=Limibacillus sp. MBR-115 TaxID=3156465 RepID=UPI0033994C6A